MASLNLLDISRHLMGEVRDYVHCGDHKSRSDLGTMTCTIDQVSSSHSLDVKVFCG